MTIKVYESPNSRMAIFKFTGTSPAEAGVAAIDEPVERLESYDEFTVYADLVGATGGTLDIRLQQDMEPATGVWRDWLSFAQLAAGAAAIKKAAATTDRNLPAVTVGDGTTPALAATDGNIGRIGSRVRVIATAGASTSVGAAVTIWLICRRHPNS
jgi:hypothetical protein